MQVLRNQYSHNKAPQPESQGAVDGFLSVSFSFTDHIS